MKKNKQFKMRCTSPVSFKPVPMPADAATIVSTIAATHSKPAKPSASEFSLTNEDLHALAEAVVGVWRAKQRILSGTTTTNVSPEMKNILRRIESVLEQFAKMRLEPVDFTGEPFVQGMALNVISSQPNSALTSDRIHETLKPTVRFRGRFIQAGDVIIEGPLSHANTTQQIGKA